MKKTFILFTFFLIIKSSFYCQNKKHQSENLFFTNQIENAKKLLGKNNELAIKKLEELKIKATKENNQETIFKTNYELSLIYMNISNELDKTVELTYEMEKYIKDKKDYIKLAEILQMRGISYLTLNVGKKGLENLNNSLKYLELVEPQNEIFLKRAIIYNNISDHYFNNKDFDKEYFYKKKSFNETMKMKDINGKNDRDKYIMLAFINVQFGNIKEKKRELDSANFFYNNSVNLFNEYGNELTLYGKVSALNGLSSISYENKNYTDAITYAEKALNSNYKKDQPKLRRDIYLLLQKSYLEIKKTDSARKYLELYTKLNDSIVSAEQQQQNKALNKLITENEKENSKKVRDIYLICISIFIFILIAVAFIIIRHNRIQKEKYDALIQKIQNEETIIDTEKLKAETINTLNIHNDTLIHILTGLKKFEQSKKFLSNTTSLTTLATDLSTNTKYLSQIINEQKGKSFNNYINELRINYICEELYKKPKLRKYKVTVLADLAGFSSREVFTNIFKKVTGISPSVFLKNLEENG